MSQKTSINDATVEIIENALTALQTEEKYGVATDQPSHGKSNIYNVFVTAIIATQDADRVTELRDAVKASGEKDVKVFGDDQHTAMAILDIDRSIAVELFIPSQGSFAWDKTDWISKKAEFEAFKTHVERVISKHFNYRIFHARPEKAS